MNGIIHSVRITFITIQILVYYVYVKYLYSIKTQTHTNARTPDTYPHQYCISNVIIEGCNI